MGEKYNIGLDIGTSSVGWAVTDMKAHMLKHKGQNMWGVRLFEEAKTAATRRSYRSNRRRLDRRKQRLNQLQEIFNEEISKIDPNFFIRLKESFLYTEDNSTLSASILFDDGEFTDKEYYKKYPTIYHLRKDLMESNDKKDIRLVYLALHHMLKYRGHFLYGKGELGQGSENIEASLEQIFLFIINDEFDSIDIDLEEVINILASADSKKTKQELLKKIIKHSDKEINTRIQEMIKAILGYKFSLSKLFRLEEQVKKDSVSFKDDLDEVEIESLLQEYMEIYNSLNSIYSWVTLEELLGDIESKDSKDKTISNAMITKYNNHAKQLKMLKTLVKETCSRDDYNKLFRLENQKNNYLNYIKNTKNNSLEDFNKYIKSILKKYPKTLDHKYYYQLSKPLEENALLSKLNTTDNSVIPYQLQKVEMERILDNQGKYYSFFTDNKELLLKVLVSRLPYYIGPLNRNSEFAWNIPLKDNKRTGKLYPWNYEEFIDIDNTAEKFIKKMTNKCTYLRGKDVIPRHSLLYSEFVLLNELNKVKVNNKFISEDVKEEIIEDLFKRKKTVKVKDLEEWIRKNPSGFLTNKSDDVLIEGTQEEDQFAASLGSYFDFLKIFGEIDDSNIKMIEEIINWITIFEDKDILKRKINDKYQLDKIVVDRIIKLKYSGWSRLSKELIDGIRTQKTKWTGYTIIEIMRKTNLNFMQIINDSDLDFKEIIDILNFSDKKTKIRYEDIKELHGSPALKRGIWETIKIIDEIIKVMGSEPENIVIEFARSDEESKRSTSRINRMKTLYEEIKKDGDIYNKEVYDELQSRVKAKEKLDIKALYLYFTQNGRCMYTGAPLDPEHLYRYEIDHIIPRSYIKNDSIDNLVLVTAGANQNKKDNLLLKPEIRRKQMEYWNNLYKYGLISKKKLENLNRDVIPDKELIGFINRQLVETRQISKHISELLSEIYVDTKIISIKAKLTSDFREQYKLYKNRNVNDYHHAHDALIVSVIGNFILNRYPFLENELDIKKYITLFKKEKMHSDKKNKYGFILASMNRNYLSDGFIWVKNEEICKVKKALSYKDCFITKKVEEQTGEFFDATIYNRNHPNAKVPIKEDLSPKKYGGRSSIKSAYYVAIQYNKGNKKVKKIISIPIYKTKYVEGYGLFDYLLETEDIKDKNSLIVLKDKIKKYQLVEFQGHEVYFISEGEQQNAVQLIIENKYLEMFDKLNNTNRAMLEDAVRTEIEKLMIEFFDYFVEKLLNYYPLYNNLVDNIKNSRNDFVQFDFDMKFNFINELLKITAAKSSIGKFKSFETEIKVDDAGRIRKVWNVDDMIFIDKSITGLFERRYRL